jgi:indole-3-glycerol phosphate synthase
VSGQPTILDQLAEYARQRVEQAKKVRPSEEIRQAAEALPVGDFAFEKALGRSGLSFICECKKASPSKGLIAPDFPYATIAKEYEAAGADAISVLTEPKWFLGQDVYLREIAATVSVPCLRKDFTVDAYMIYEAKLLGASAVLLICAILEPDVLRQYLRLCDQLGLSALVEAHDESEVAIALQSGARIIGVNNRNLKDFSVDSDNSRRLRDQIPPDVLFVSESGVRSAEDVRSLRDIGADAVLIGETLMRAQDKRAKLAELRSLL